MFHQIADYIVKHGNVFFPGWFGGRNAEDITESEFRAMFAANYHNKSVAKMSKLQNQQFDSLLKILRDRTGAGFKEEDGSSGRVYYDDTEGFPAGYLQHTRDNLHVVHHPLILYLWSHIAGIASEFVLWGLCFNKECDAETSISYWHKPAGLPVSVCQQRKPIVFAHGMGVGLSAYLHVIWSLCNLSSYTMDAEEAVDNRDVYLMDFPHIAMRICDDVPTVDTINETIRNFLRNDGHTSASFVGHSYGSVILARMAKTYPHLMHTSIYIDPICFLLYIPKVVNSFVYRKPDNHWFQWARYYGCSRELYMQNVLCRNFWWYQYNMHPTEIPANSLVVASMKDDIVPSDLVVDHIKHLSPETKLMLPDYYHAEFMAHPYFIGDLMTQLVALEDGVELTKQRKDKVFAA
ncbi:hypothetical protein SARC_05308 [Sphaeroforma arctica JP610]|uniref:AB hydrolase-1 domain-containing protein n=1 Tax=Sphaeroforma arctica JP610 TaxID=667725 RepID=A0A0L0FZX1_9EUKA|nr:hypothetical protein SARC_05308 [Sphaeroforma arctica JP610]KNC82412.1 hypothetical protein SARC_05308 [Sphaeroforma arctica JP610]|eukprot:XP_014156314.1 hypothetical protein SARC_05308 [Sphaeroforma arctica JP610]